MNTLVRVVAVGLSLILGTASGAHAAISASGSLSISIASFPTLEITGSGSGSSAGVGGSASLAAGVLSGNDTVPFGPLSTIIDGLRIAAPGGITVPANLSLPAENLPLSFNGTTGTMGLNASAYMLMGTVPVAEIPLGVVGVGGSQMFHLLSIIPGTAFANPYQLGMVTIMGNLNATPHTLSGTGVDNRTAAGAGTLVLVSPMSISLGTLGSMASLATLTLTYVPEPGTLLLLGAGVAGLAAVGERRRRASALRSLR